MALADIQVRKAKHGPKPYKMGDGGNLYLWVTPAGGKIWRWAYRFDGKKKLMTLGSYPDVPLAKARERHLEGRRLLAEGTDPPPILLKSVFCRRRNGENPILRAFLSLGT